MGAPDTSVRAGPFRRLVSRLDGPGPALAVLCALAVLASLPHFAVPAGPRATPGWARFQDLVEAGRTAVVEHGEFPGWSSGTCGGAPLHADPVTPFLSPAFLLPLAFGTGIGLKLMVLAHLLAGLAGAWYLARSIGRSGIAGIGLGVALAAAAWPAWVVAGDRPDLLCFLLLPWPVAFLARATAAGDAWLRWAAAGAAALALIALDGGLPAAAAGATASAGYAALRLVAGRPLRRALGPLAVVVGAGAMLAAPKLLPVIESWPPPAPDCDALARLRADAVVASPVGGAARVLERTQGRYELWVSAAGSPEVRLRTAWAPGWRSDTGLVTARDGGLAIVLPEAKSRHVGVWYSAAPVVAGLAIAACVPAVMLAVSIARARRRRDPAAAPAADEAGAPGAGRIGRIAAIAAGAGVAFLYLYPFPFFGKLTNPAEDSRLLMTRGIVDHGTFAVNRSWGHGYLINRDLAIRDGKYYSCKAPGTSYLGVPVLWAARKAGIDEPDRLEEIWVSRLFVSAIPTAAFVLLFGRFARRFVRDRAGRVLVTIGLGAGTMSLTYGIQIYGHQQAAIALFAAFACLYANRRRGGGSIGLLAAAGACLGLAVSCEYQAALSALVIGLYGLWTTDRWWKAAFMGVGAALPIALTLYYHHAAFGSMTATGIDFLENASYREYQKHGFRGMLVFSWDGFWGTLFAPKNGLLFYSPWLAFVVPGLVAMYRRPDLRREAVCVGAAVLAYVFYISTLFAWKGGWSVGPRYLAAIVPFVALPVAVFLDTPAGRRWWVRVLVAATVAVSVVVYGLSSALYPHLPDYIDNPFFEFLLPLLRTGHVPWTLGHLVGLSGLAALLPYLLVLSALVAAVVWAGASFPADDGSAPPPAPRTRRKAAALVVLVAFIGMWAMSLPATEDREAIKTNIELADHVWEP
ncbi:MAG: hypothetical protein FJ087_03630 [Deltaproteobacteria bacterium]|nr:hypothetical protein [Deltaproteobacteria bacterium]